MMSMGYDMMVDNFDYESIEVQEDYYDGYWKQKNGKYVRISDMTDIHLTNTINMLRRQIDGSSHDDFVYDNITSMENELKRRNSTMSDKISNVEFKVVGVTFSNPDGSSRKDKILEMANNKTNTIIEIEREPNNQYDPNAIMVKADGIQIGYVSKDYASILAPMIDIGRQFKASIKDCGEYKNRPYAAIIVNEL